MGEREKAAGSSVVEGLRNLTPAERLEKISDHLSLAPSVRTALAGENALSPDLANGMIENVVGKFELPLGVATNFLINDQDYLVPMAVEEPSVVAAASYMAKLVREHGGFQTESTAPIMRGQIQVLGLKDIENAKNDILNDRKKIVGLANQKDQILVGLGGGCKDLVVHLFEQTPIGPMLVVHLLVDVRDAMGANSVNTMVETVAPYIEQITSGEVRLRILSNLADKRLAKAKLELPFSALDTTDFSGERVANGIVEACAFAVVDPYRAATHNKGIMNGIDPIILATGNDWRAIEAGAHAYAARNGRYSSLTEWKIEGQTLMGSIEMPMAVGLVGGATKTHPGAQAALKLLNVKSAQELAEVCVAVGLAQNMAALRALSTEGIQRGHMALHARNIAIGAGAVGDEVDKVAKRLSSEKDVRVDKAKEILNTLRDQI